MSELELGVWFPTYEIGNDPEVIRTFAQQVEAMGYRDMVIEDHVIGADPTNRPDWKLHYTIKHAFHEPFTLMGFLASCTTTLRFLTGIIILPQRQTALVAKQAAQVDLLSGGRLTLGVAVGRFDNEYEALNMDFHTRGARIEEQVEVLRELWTKEVVTYHGKFHRISQAGINPLPVQRPIPIWMGAVWSDKPLQRAARMADGFIAGGLTPEDTSPIFQKLRRFLGEAGRDASRFPMGVRMQLRRGEPPDKWRREVDAWRELSPTHLVAVTYNGGFQSMDERMDALGRFRELARG